MSYANARIRATLQICKC